MVRWLSANVFRNATLPHKIMEGFAYINTLMMDEQIKCQNTIIFKGIWSWNLFAVLSYCVLITSSIQDQVESWNHHFTFDLCFVLRQVYIEESITCAGAHPHFQLSGQPKYWWENRRNNLLILNQDMWTLGRKKKTPNIQNPSLGAIMWRIPLLLLLQYPPSPFPLLFCSFLIKPSGVVRSFETRTPSHVKS